MKASIGAATFAAVALAASGAQAAKIIAPISVVANVGGTAGDQFFAVDNIIDQSGMSATYVAGATEFEDFVAGDPVHGSALATRWLSQSNLSSARITFDFGRIVKLAKLAIWDDRSTTISQIRLSTPDLGAFRDLQVTDVLQTASHAEVFAFTPVTTRYLTFDITGCNREGSAQNWSGCGLNEVVFAEGIAGGIPEPATWAMMILGFGAAGAVLRRRALAAAV